MKVSQHAINRYRERFKECSKKHKTDSGILKGFLKREKKKAMCVSRKQSLRTMMEHGFEHAEIYATEDIVFVVVKGILKTVYPLRGSIYHSRIHDIRNYCNRKYGGKLKKKKNQRHSIDVYGIGTRFKNEAKGRTLSPDDEKKLWASNLEMIKAQKENK